MLIFKNFPCGAILDRSNGAVGLIDFLDGGGAPQKNYFSKKMRLVNAVILVQISMESEQYP